jgi:SAM-dependent methyltransferase
MPVLAHSYSQGERERAPADAVVNSFGCGNPIFFAHVGAGDVVLDLGCGAGLDVILAAEKTGPTGKVIGLDLSEEMLARAAENVARAGRTNVELRKGFIEDLPVEAGTVDRVISNCVINLSPDKLQVFREIARVLKPDGRMLVSDIVAHDVPDWVRENSDLYASCISGALSESDYLDAVRKGGLEDVWVVDRLDYPGRMIATLVRDRLPVAFDALAARRGVSPTDLTDQLTRALDGKVASIMVAARKR